MTRRPTARDEAPQARRVTAAVIDAALALLCGLAAGLVAGVEVVDSVAVLRPGSPRFWGVALGAALAFSFLNHVLLAWATRAGLGKLVTGLRVIRVSDGGRPGVPRLAGRWLFGFYWAVVFVPVHVAADSDIESVDAAGLRTVRRTH